MLNIDPWDKSIRPYLNPIKSVVCSKIPLLTYVQIRKGVGNVLKIDEVTHLLSFFKKATEALTSCKFWGFG